MRVIYIALIVINALLCINTPIRAKPMVKDEEIEVKIQFLEYELEDLCILKNEAMWKFFNGTDPDLRKILNLEMREYDVYQKEVDILQKHTGKNFSTKKLQRLVDVFSHPGAPLLGNMEFKEYKDYSIKLEEMKETMKIKCPTGKTTLSTIDDTSNFKNINSAEKPCSINDKKLNQILFDEKNYEKLKDIWMVWYQELEKKNKRTKYDFVQQLSILDLEAEQNGEEELAEYWLKQSDITWVNYDTAKSLWQEILPLYEKLKNYIKSLVIRRFGNNVLTDQELIPVHVLGSLETYDWVTAADKLGAFENSNAYKTINDSISNKNFQNLYKMADNLTAELKLGYLPQTFYEKSRFNESSQTCRNKITNYCERENVIRAMTCIDKVPKINDYIKIVEDTLKVKYLRLSGKEEEENGYLFREGPRDSVLYEAMESFMSLKALSPENLQNLQLLPNKIQQKEEMLSLFLIALNVIPQLPYYLASDLWRINALQEIDAVVGENTGDTSTTTISDLSSTSQDYLNYKKREIFDKKANLQSSSGVSEFKPQLNQNITELINDFTRIYDTQNLTKDWWNFRMKYQGIGSPDGQIYEDYLQDTKIIWNKPYISKFLGKIIQFQILEVLQSENNSGDLFTLQAMMQKGKSKSWEALAVEFFNITQISTKPLLKYFKPLTEFLEKGMKAQNQNQTFNLDDFNFISQEFSLNPVSNEKEGEKPEEGSDAMFFSLAVVAAVGIVAVIVTIGRRRYKKRQRTRERKRRLAAL